MNLLAPLAHIVVTFILDGNKYDVEQFKIGFAQPTDYKGQPQHEIKGGKIMVVLPQSADDNLYMWAKKSTMLKSGLILFQTDLGMTVLEITFTNAYCTNLTREINALSGTNTTLMIAPEQVHINGVEHDNIWRK